mmetsp:Transcript_23659/g.70724  ORF Transcript_23659/g.70724 Transcript_23659/m.70724 type:complete len:154 (-) Transcript_23659:504-965(-)
MDLYRPMIPMAGDGGAAAPEGDADDKTIRVTVNGKIRKYVSAAKRCLASEGGKRVVVYGEGRAVTKAIGVAEILKHRILGLHQNTQVGMSKVTEVWEPKLDVEEDVDRVQVVRRIPTVTVLLSLNPLDTAAPGYQPPLSEAEVAPDSSMDGLA